MNSRRQRKISTLIQKSLSQILQKHGSNIYGQSVLASVTEVRVSPDLSQAKIYLSIFNAEDAELVIIQIAKNLGAIKNELARDLRNQLRRIPELQVFRDDSIEEGSKIDQLLKKYKSDDTE